MKSDICPPKVKGKERKGFCVNRCMLHSLHSLKFKLLSRVVENWTLLDVFLLD